MSCKTQDISSNYDSKKYDPSNLFIASEIDNNEHFTFFKSEMCKNKSEKECGTIYNEMVFARLRERYYFASDKTVMNHCTAYPVECRNIQYLEMLYIRNHNDNVEMYKLEAQVKADKEDTERSRAGWAAFGEALQRQETQRQNNAPIQTNCYNDGYGNTRCTSSK